MQPEEAVVDSETRDDLNRFAHMVWATPQDISKTHSEGFEYIDIGRCLAGFRDLFGGTLEEKILVRDEYRIAAQELQTASYHQGAYVTGQPGIGKSHFLIYLLVRLLGQGCKVAVHDTTHKYYAVFAFGVPVAFYPLTYTTPLKSGGPMWALSDSGKRNDGAPPERFYADPKRIRLIQATSPKKRRWHEWSKQAKAECYVMDIWTEQEIANFANLLGYDAQRMVDLGKKWGGVPGTLLKYFAKSDGRIENSYRRRAPVAIQRCQNAIRAMVNQYLPEDSDVPSQFFFCRPVDYGLSSIDRTEICATVPTHTICDLLGSALQEIDNAIMLEFFTALRQHSATRQAAGFIFEAWFHCFMSTADKSIDCHWLDNEGNVSKLYGTSGLASGSATELNARQELPYYWPAGSSYPGIDGALIYDNAIYAFQITISSKHKSPQPGVRKLRGQLPANLRDLPWHVVFVGNTESSSKAVAMEWMGKVFLMDTSKTPVSIAWSAVEPVAEGVIYRMIRNVDESMEIVNE